ncbi:MAG: AAA family ATPase [Endomicrobium sp.]|nr:AAA family ATPase [Endomicrobium sp.]
MPFHCKSGLIFLSEINGSAYLLLDEIQEVENWEKCVNSLRVKTNYDIYITGANAKMLSSELSTLISGRYIKFVVYPFSLAEYLRLNQKEPSKQYLEDLFSTIVLKDIMKRRQINEVDLLNRFITYAMGNIGKTFCQEAFLLYKVSRKDTKDKKVLFILIFN